MAMPVDTGCELSNAEIAAMVANIVAVVFETTMSLEVSGNAAPLCAAPDRLSAAVHLSGEWNGAVIVECGQTEACRLAARFLSMDPPETVDDVVRDVFGELANMIGGNLKSVLSRGIRLSMPTVSDGSDYAVRICGSEVIERLPFECSEGPFQVTLLTSIA
jgi:chemotaxis protein CheX